MPSRRADMSRSSGKAPGIESFLLDRIPDVAVPIYPSRLQASRLREGVVPRPALVATLEQSSEQQVVLVSAPSGYGKTTLLKQWADSDQRPFAWMAADETWNDPSVFVTYLAVALSRVTPIDLTELRGLVAPHAAERSAVLVQIANAVSMSPLPFVLVLDGAHHLHDREPLEALEVVIESLAPGSQVALACRESPSLPCHRLRVEGKVFDVGVNELRFGRVEALDLLARAGVQATDQQLDVLLERTEGWAAGLYMAALTGTADGFPESVLFGQEAPKILTEYIRSEFLERLEPEVLSFLLGASVLDDMTGPLCDAALERDDSAMILRDLQLANLMVVPLDGEREWFRFHHLFRAALNIECERTTPDAEVAISVRAADWAFAEGRVDDAVRYAQRAGDVPRVSQIVRTAAMRYYATGRVAVLEEWFDWLWTHDCVDGGAAVQGAWVALLSGRAAEADQWASIADRAPRHDEMPEGSPLEAWVATLRGAMANDVERMFAESRSALQLLAPHSQWYPTAMTSLGSAEILRGNSDVADQHLQDAVELGDKVGGFAAQALALALRASIAIDRGDWPTAGELVGDSEAVLDRAHVGSYVSASLTHAVAARVAAHGGDYGGARQLVARAEGPRLPGSRSLPYLALHTRIHLVLAHLALGELSAAAERLDETRELQRTGRAFGTLSLEVSRLEVAIEERRAALEGTSALSPAEARILPFLATHLTFREVAGELFLSVHTVRAQVASIYRKFGVASRAAAVQRGRDLGLLPPPT